MARNTPTGVGKTPTIRQTTHLAQKHPHGRGEDLSFALLFHPELETPPRAWGRHKAAITLKLYDGNTPTGVGKTEQATGNSS